MWAAFLLAGMASLITGHAMSAGAADDPVPVVVSGAGDSDTAGELVTWQDALFSATRPTDFSYAAVGSKDGRRNLLAGNVDFTMGAVPFTDAELAARPADAGKIIEAPISVASLTILATTPPASKGGWGTETPPTNCDPDDPNTDPATCQVIKGTFDGPFRIPPENLSALIVGLSFSSSNDQISWRNQTWMDAVGASNLSIQRLGLHHTFVNRTDGSAQNEYLMQYAKELGPVSWGLRLAENPEYKWEPIGENLSPRTKPTRSGTDQQVGVMAFATVDALSNGSPDDWTGNMGAVPTTLVGKLNADYPGAKFVQMEIQNRHGDWVLPTQETIDAALAAGDDPDIAATDDVPGAYPLVYVNRLYTVAGTLSPEEANALAASVRYIATDGQQTAIEHGGASLTPALQTEALAAADEIVVKNCTEDGYEVTSSGPSDAEPDTPGVQAITSMKHCTLAPIVTTTTSTTVAPTTTESTTTTVAATTTTVAETTTTTEVASQAPVATVYVPPYRPPTTNPPYVPPATVETTPPETTPPETTEPPPTTTEVTTTTLDQSATSTTVAGGGGTRLRGVALTKLPMDPPDDGSSGFKKLGTLLLGAGMFLGGRRLVGLRRVAT